MNKYADSYLPKSLIPVKYATMINNHRNLPLLLLKTREHFMTHFRPILKQNGITEQQWRIIQALDEFGDMEPRKLCEQCCILSPSMAGILKRMEDMALIIKQSMQDQRRIRITLTPKANKLFAVIQQQVTEEYARIEENLDTETLHNLYTVLDKLIERV